jgi:hypothetical protein
VLGHRTPGTGLAGPRGGRRGRRDGSGCSPVSPPKRVCHAAKCDPAARHTRLGRTAITKPTNDVSTRGSLQPRHDKPKKLRGRCLVVAAARFVYGHWPGWGADPRGISHSCHVKLSAAKEHDTTRRHNFRPRVPQRARGSCGEPVSGSRCVSLVSVPCRWRPPTLPSNPQTAHLRISQHETTGAAPTSPTVYRICRDADVAPRP